MSQVKKSSYLSERLNYNMLKGYYGIFAQWCQKKLPTEALKVQCVGSGGI